MQLTGYKKLKDKNYYYNHIVNLLVLYYRGLDEMLISIAKTSIFRHY